MWIQTRETRILTRAIRLFSIPAICFCVIFAASCAPKRVVTSPVSRDQAITPAPPPVQPQPSHYKIGLAAASLAGEQVGKPYRYGAQGPDTFDCSGLMLFVFGSQGVELPRTVREQASTGRRIARDQLVPGDLLFFTIDTGLLSHVGIYVGRDEFVHAPRSGKVVCKESLKGSWWNQKLGDIRRVF